MLPPECQASERGNVPLKELGACYGTGVVGCNVHTKQPAVVYTAPDDIHNIFFGALRGNNQSYRPGTHFSTAWAWSLRLPAPQNVGHGTSLDMERLTGSE
jgi:hypothetical protein